MKTDCVFRHSATDSKMQKFTVAISRLSLWPTLAFCLLLGCPISAFSSSNSKLVVFRADGQNGEVTTDLGNFAPGSNPQPVAATANSSQSLSIQPIGQYFDLESGWNHNGLRNYFPSLGRYAEPDPLAIQGSARHIAQTGLVVSDYLNSVEWGGSMYVYAVNSPTSIVDPTGGQTLAVGPNTTPEQVAAFNAGFAEALNRLKNNPDCRKLFCKNKGGLDPEKVLDDTEYRILPFEGSHAGAQTNSVNSVFLNLNGPFFGNPSKNGTATTYIPSSNPQLNTSTQVTFGSQSQLQAFILLHELGHQLGIFPDDVFKFINGSNSLKVLEHCFKDAKYN